LSLSEIYRIAPKTFEQISAREIFPMNSLKKRNQLESKD
jgi:hypothetical protein